MLKTFKCVHYTVLAYATPAAIYYLHGRFLSYHNIINNILSKYVMFRNKMFCVLYNIFEVNFY